MFKFLQTRLRRKSMNNNEINIIAERLLQQCGYNADCDTYVDSARVATSLGFKVGESSRLDEKEDGFISISADKKNLLIGVNHDRSLDYKRFVVSHEVGHYYLHYENTTLKSAVMHRENIKGKNAKENEADFFAACLLMPTKSFLKQYNILKEKGYTGDEIVSNLQRIFRTPEESIKRRIEEVCGTKK